jgi:uncharacterized protein (DUF58 family)
MKTHRLVFCLIAGFCLVAGLLSGSRVFYVLLFAQASLLLFALALSLWAVISFTYLQNLSSQTSSRGQPVTLNLEIHNEKSLPYPLMHIRVQVADEPATSHLTFNLPPDSHRSFAIELGCPYRGIYEVGMTVIDFLDLFGLLRLPFDMRLLPYYRLLRLVVYPRLIQLEKLAMPALDVHQFTRHVNLTEDQEQPFAMVRPYRPGDPGKQIHWKVSLRNRQLMTRVYELATEPTVELHLDLYRTGPAGESTRQSEDIFCEAATALVYYLLRQNWHLRLTGYGRQLQQLSGSTLKDFKALHQWLAEVGFDSRSGFVRRLRADPGIGVRTRAIILLTTRLEPDLGDLLGQPRLSRTPIYTLIAGPAKSSAPESQIAGLFRQSGWPVWFIHYGDKLEQVLQGLP